MHASHLYDDCRDAPKVIETHISHLFLTDEHVYKLKKPVNLGFLDYSTLEKRHAACQAELEINRRLAPHVYLDVVSIGHRDGVGWQLDGDAEPADWLVKMVRLPDDRCLETMIEKQTWTDADIQKVIELLVAFYRSLRPIREHRFSHEQHVIDNRRELERSDYGFDRERIVRIHAAQTQYLFLQGAMFDERRQSGKVIEGHGDLRAEHVYVTDPPVAIDGIEFSRDLRIVDVADELCFFAVTCESLEATTIGDRVRRRVLDALGDQPDETLLHFYSCYRACVRAKVHALRTTQVTGDLRDAAQCGAETFLCIADRHASKIHRPIAIIVRGLSGTGKTTLAGALSDRLGATHLSTDQIRKDSDRAPSYSGSARRAVYETLTTRAAEILGKGESVVLDGTFLTTQRMRLASDRFATDPIGVVFITCVCPDGVAIERIRERQADGSTQSEADEAVFHDQTGQMEPVPSQWPSMEIDTTQDSDCQLAQLRTGLLALLN